MAHQPSDTRLRRHVIGATPDPHDHKSGMPTSGHSLNAPIFPSPQGEIEIFSGEVVSTGHPGATHASCIAAHYADRASAPKSGEATVNRKAPFELTK